MYGWMEDIRKKLVNFIVGFKCSLHFFYLFFFAQGPIQPCTASSIGTPFLLFFPVCLLCSFYLMTPLAHTARHRRGGNADASRRQWDGGRKWQAFVFLKYARMRAEVRGQKGNNLFTCSVWLSKPWQWQGLVASPPVRPTVAHRGPGCRCKPLLLCWKQASQQNNTRIQITSRFVFPLWIVCRL